MAQRYKEEMMRLYQKREFAAKNSAAANNTAATNNVAANNNSAANNAEAARIAAAERNGGIMGRGAGMSGNPIQNGAPSASAIAQRNIMRNENMINADPQSRNRDPQTGRNTAGTPVPGADGASYYGMKEHSHSHGHGQGQHAPDNGPSIPVNCDCRFPSAESIINSIANTPMTLPITPEDNPTPVSGPNTSLIQPRAGADTADMNGERADNGVRLRSIIINTSPDDPVYTLPDRSDEEREVMPDFALPADVSADSGATVPVTSNFSPSRSWISLTGDNSWGFLQVEVYTSGGDFPLQGAMVIVKKVMPSGSGIVRVLFTDQNGFTPTIALPAQAILLPTADAVRPFSEYEITVVAAGYYTLRNVNIAIYAGSKTVQPIDLIPLQNVYPPQPRTDGSGDISVG